VLTSVFPSTQSERLKPWMAHAAAHLVVDDLLTRGSWSCHAISTTIRGGTENFGACLLCTNNLVAQLWFIRILLVGSICGPLASTSCSYRDIGVRCSVVGPFLRPDRRPGTRDLSRSFDSFRRDLKTFLFSFY